MRSFFEQKKGNPEKNTMAAFRRVFLQSQDGPRVLTEILRDLGYFDVTYPLDNVSDQMDRHVLSNFANHLLVRRLGVHVMADEASAANFVAGLLKTQTKEED